jgi:hypothetical protein
MAYQTRRVALNFKTDHQTFASNIPNRRDLSQPIAELSTTSIHRIKKLWLAQNA